MILWRIAQRRFADLSGRGGLYYSGRWHKRGSPIVYFAEHPALSILEVRVNMDIEAKFLADYVLMQVEISDNIFVKKIDDDPSNEINCQKLGDDWLKRQESLLCRVRSFVSPQSYNFLFNPLHKDAKKAEIIDISPFDFDERLFRIRTH